MAFSLSKVRLAPSYSRKTKDEIKTDKGRHFNGARNKNIIDEEYKNHSLHAIGSDCLGIV